MNVWPADRQRAGARLRPGFAAALKATVPLPVPLPPLVTVNQVVRCCRRSTHTRPARVTVVDPVPPVAADRLTRRRDRIGAGAAAWSTVNVWPAIVSVPLRGAVFGFAAGTEATVPLPDPLAPLVTVNQSRCC